MLALTLFHLFRHVLVVVVLTYTVVKLVRFIWTFSVSGEDWPRSLRMARRYLVANVLAVRLRLFWLDFLQIAVLSLVLWWVVSVQL